MPTEISSCRPNLLLMKHDKKLSKTQFTAAPVSALVTGIPLSSHYPNLDCIVGQTNGAEGSRSRLKIMITRVV